MSANLLLSLTTVALLVATVSTATHPGNPEDDSSSLRRAAGEYSPEHAFPIAPEAGTMTIYRRAIEYHLIHGDWTECEDMDGHQVPSGDGPHVVEFASKGAPEQPITVNVANTGEVYVTEFAIIVDFTSRDNIVFEDLDDLPSSFGLSFFDCDGTYSNVLSYARNGDCWGTTVTDLQTGTWTQPCNSPGGECKAVVTYGSGEPYTIKNITWHCGTGSASGNAQQGTGFATDAANGC